MNIFHLMYRSDSTISIYYTQDVFVTPRMSNEGEFNSI